MIEININSSFLYISLSENPPNKQLEIYLKRANNMKQTIPKRADY